MTGGGNEQFMHGRRMHPERGAYRGAMRVQRAQRSPGVQEHVLPWRAEQGVVAVALLFVELLGQVSQPVRRGQGTQDGGQREEASARRRG